MLLAWIILIALVGVLAWAIRRQMPREESVEEDFWRDIPLIDWDRE